MGIWSSVLILFLVVIKVTCALIVDEQNRVLAAQRSGKMSMPLKWEFPGGKIEPNETAEDCLVREIKEELSIDVQILNKLPSNIHTYPKITIELIPFICLQINGIIILKEHVSFKWLYKNELLAFDWADADLPIVSHYLRIS